MAYKNDPLARQFQNGVNVCKYLILTDLRHR